MTALESRLEDKARALGFHAIGICDAAAAPETRARLKQWLEAGRHGDMLWMEERAEQRGSPQGLWPEVRSVIVLGQSYAPKDDPLLLEAHPDRARFSVYARGQDYHDIVKRALKQLATWLVGELPGEDVKVFVDTAPVMEKPLAAAAGVGWQGKHSCVVSREHGSWLFLGAIYTTAALIPSQAGTDRCGSCHACQDACPTDAFPAPYVVDARRCISYLTIEHKGPIPEEFRRPIGNRVYGCDDCLAVCPWNKFADAAATQRAYLPRAELVAPDIGGLLALSDAEFRQVFAGSPIKRTGRDRMVRNACIAAGNSGEARFIQQLEALTNDPCDYVAEAARWALGELNAA